MEVRLEIYSTPAPISRLTALFFFYFPHSLHRHATPDKFYIEACDDGANDVLVIDRASMEMTLMGKSC